jgi:uncharacterized membrane protein (DUF4010 family)
MEKPPFQFTLASVFKAMTVVGVLLAIWIFEPGFFLRLLDQVLSLACFLGTIAIIVWISLWFDKPSPPDA